MEKLVIPKFNTEAEEAEWWYQNRDALAEEFELAGRKGGLNFGSNALRRAKGDVLVRVSPEDAAAIQKRAAQNGQPEAAYAGAILHEALQQRVKELQK
jgi:predicted DNA binding CopG/RHH family protein